MKIYPHRHIIANMRFDSRIYPIDADSVRENVLSIVATSSTKIAPFALEKRLFEEFGINKKQIKSVIRELVAGGELAYIYEYGSTFLARSFARPVRISKHIVVQPPGYHHRSDPNDVVVSIKPGASFGAGNHPTTRLAIKGIEFVLLGGQVDDKRHDTGVLDIGTGSAILLITAILCGMKTGLGIDTDACARFEAAENVRINGLEDRVAISGLSIADIGQRFSIILANLRYPSLIKMRFQINEKVDPNSFLIFSGIKDNELLDLLKVYRNLRFEKLWADGELGWSGAVLQKLS